MTNAPHVTILSGNMGGHPRIAQALTTAISRLSPQARVETIDQYDRSYVSRPVARASNAYEMIVAGSRNTWRAIYHLSNQPPALRLLRWMVATASRRSTLDGVLNRPPEQGGPPDVLVRVISDLGQESRMARRAGRLPPVITVVSDLANLHRGWLTKETRLYVLPTREAYDACRAMGVPGHMLQVLGFPIRSELFCRPWPEAEPAQEQLRGDCIRVLMMGGSSGSGGRIVRDVRRLLASGLPLELTVVCGRNLGLQRRLSQLQLAPAAPGCRLTLLGYTDRIPELMHAADLLVTKAGPSTLFEAAACGLPAIINGFLPGQEAGNIDYFVRQGVALGARRTFDTVALVEALYADRPRLRALRNPALAATTCAAAQRIARVILETAAGENR